MCVRYNLTDLGDEQGLVVGLSHTASYVRGNTNHWPLLVHLQRGLD